MPQRYSSLNYKKPFSRKLSDFLLKTVFAAILTVICAIPFEIWYAIYKFANPVGFWQKFAIVGGGVWVFGAFQLIGFFGWCAGMLFIITEL